MRVSLVARRSVWALVSQAVMATIAPARGDVRVAHVLGGVWDALAILLRTYLDLTLRPGLARDDNRSSSFFFGVSLW